MRVSKIQKKQLFLLLELMVALSLVALCALPVIRAPFVYIKKQTLCLQNIQLHIEAEKALAEVKEKFYKNTIEWKQIEQAAKQPLVLSQETVNLTPFGYAYIKTCTLKSAEIEEGKNEELYAKVVVDLMFCLPRNKKPELKVSHTLSLCQKIIPIEIGSSKIQEK